MATEPNGSQIQNTTTPPTPTTLNPEEVARKFYETYDVMTGVRIAATLGGFFGLMVILVLYKSKSKTEKALEDPDFTAAAVAEVEEEERQLAAVLEATAYQQLNPRKGRRSLDTSSMPPGWNKTTRFSSVGGYSSLMEPPTRTHSRLPQFIDEDSPFDEDRSIYEDVYYNGHLDVPRRPSNITCSSSGSSYLERRDSAVAIGLPVLPGHKSKNRRRQSSPLLEIYDFYYPIDIKVIQPTPGGSPCGSDRAIYDHVAANPPTLIPRLAPLASISSCNSSLGADYTDLDVVSYTSDSVFQDDRDSTDDEVEQFSTDSDLSDAGACYNRKKKKNRCSESLVSTPVNDGPSSVATPKIGVMTSKSSSTLVESPHQPQIFITDNSSSSSSINIEEVRAVETLF